MGDFVRLDITTEPQVLADQAIDQLGTKWTGWEPNDADPEVIQIETLAPMAANAADAASQMAEENFRTYGTKLVGIPYNAGMPATGAATFVFTDAGEHTIFEDTEIDVDGYAFRVTTETTGTGSAVAVPIEATESGSAQNGLTGDSVSPITSVVYVAEITLVGTTSDGVDDEEDPDYLDRLSRRLQLKADTLVTLRDFEIVAQDHPSVMRAVAQRGAARNVTVTTIGYDGLPNSAAVKDELEAVYEDYREANTIVTMADATYTAVSITWAGKAYPGVDFTDLEFRVNEMLAEWLTPSVWGAPKNFGDPGTSGWYNEPTVRVNRIIDLIGDIEGMNYVTTVTITAPGGTTQPNGDVLLPGTVPLPTAGTMDGTIT